MPVAARLVAWNVRNCRLLLTKKTLACSQCEQVIPVTWNSVVVITPPPSWIPLRGICLEMTIPPLGIPGKGG